MARSEEDIAWFKSTFHPIPKAALPDDCIEYSIYALSSSLDATNDSESRLRLKEFQKYANQLQKQWLRDYIWQRQGFSLDVEKDDGEVGNLETRAIEVKLTTNAGVSFLRGRTEYGDSIEDEWVIVWLLREITKKFNDAWVKLSDNDGEFLLIEASGSFPSWLEPDVAENRVWINDGQLKIIKPAPGARTAKRTEEKLSPSDARNVILQEPKRFMHSTMMEEEAFYRLRNYPAQIKQNMHFAMVTIPRTVAFLLQQKSAYIAPAVEAFYLRDPISLKQLNTSKDSKDLPIQTGDLVTTSLQFPRVAYAQLKSQDFPVPAALQNMLPASLEGSERSMAETGMKVTCGFEMLLADSQHQDKPAVREIKLLLEDVASGEEVLPNDEEVASWDKRADDESWMDINFQDLEKELDGKKAEQGSSKKKDFGDKTTQENLQRIVKQFEEFMNDDKAGLDGAGMFDDDDDMDEDELDSDDDMEDYEASFGEDDFTKLMSEMMGMPPEVMAELMKGKLGAGAAASPAGQAAATRTKDRVAAETPDEGEDKEFEEHMRHIEKELRENGALDLNAPGGSNRAVKGEEVDSDLSDDDLDDNDIDIDLAKNLLESLKAQAGKAGPGGNMLGLMGASLPHDHDNDEDHESQAGPSSRIR